MDYIVRQKGFWAEDDDSVLKAIHEGFLQTHYAMWKELEKWPKTASGLPSTAGTTASIAFIRCCSPTPRSPVTLPPRRGKIFIGHVGDSAIILGTQDPDNPDIWRAEPLTRDHKPESLGKHSPISRSPITAMIAEESTRITQCGGKVICKSGVPRVVWNRPKMGHKGPVRRSTHIDEIPFLAVARSLGDLWSYNSEENVFVVSPEPDIRVYPVDIGQHRCLVLGTDGAWNMLTPQNAISTVCMAERANEQHMLNPVEGKTAWINPSKQLVDCAIDRWTSSKLRADNTSIVTVMLDPPGPPRAQVLKSRKRELAALNAGRSLPNPLHPGTRGVMALVTNTTPDDPCPAPEPAPEAAAKPKISIISRFPNSTDSAGQSIAHPASSQAAPGTPPAPLRDFQRAPRPATPPAPAPTTSPLADIVQCNEISSSEDTSPSRLTAVPEPTSPLLPSTSNSTRKKESRRSLNPLFSPAPSTRSSRSRALSESTSDAENDASLSQRSTRKRVREAPLKAPETPLVEVEQRCQELNAKIEQMERKVASKTALLSREVSSMKTRLGAGPPVEADHFLRSSERPRLLRTRPSATTEPALTPAKRKRMGPMDPEAPGGKSARAVASQKPVVTRSRRARVLRLKK
jgi:protein phosphatase 1D